MSMSDWRNHIAILWHEMQASTTTPTPTDDEQGARDE